MSMNDAGQTTPGGHERGWAMAALRSGTTDDGWIGACSCGFRGQWRSTDAMALEDLREHGTLVLGHTPGQEGAP